MLLDASASSPAWCTEWMHGPVRDPLADRADPVVRLDLPRALVVRQVVSRTVRRRVGREELWSGGTEAPL